jgi:hypothetical protein
VKQIFYHYELWEDYKAGMWETLPKEQEEEYLQRAIEFTGNAEEYGKAMLRVIKEWKISCEQNLTARGINHQAWIGHAAACIEHKIPEYITRLAWSFLSEEQQKKANKKADEAIKLWRQEYRRKKYAQKILTL